MGRWRFISRQVPPSSALPVVSYTHSTRKATNSEMSEGPNVEQVEVGDVSFWTVTEGAGQPMVLCHGGPGLWDDLQPVAEAVKDLVTVHRYDQRGGGRSSDAPPYTVSNLVEDVEGLRTHWGYERWMVGGHSWGATLALAYAVRHPDRVTGLLYLSGTSLGWSWHAEYKEEGASTIPRPVHDLMRPPGSRWDNALVRVGLPHESVHCSGWRCVPSDSPTMRGREPTYT